MIHVRIRRMFPSDVPDVFAVETASHELPWTRKQLYYDCLRVGYYGCVLTLDNIIKGYGLCSFSSDECHILNLAILPDIRREGYGRKLVEHMVDQARKRNTREVRLEVRASNISAIALYEKLGFLVTGRRPDYYEAKDNAREDAITMSRLIRI